jgi:hypothetical protein
MNDRHSIVRFIVSQSRLTSHRRWVKRSIGLGSSAGLSVDVAVINLELKSCGGAFSILAISRPCIA